MGIAMFSVQRTVFTVLGIFLLLALIHQQSQRYPSQRTPSVQIQEEARPEPSPAHHEPEHKPDQSTKVEQNDCGDLPGIEDIVLVLKTGATEIYEKTPIYFHTIFSCGAEYLVYSDLKQDLGRTVVRDALALMSPDMREEMAELSQYRSLRKHFENGGSASELKGDKNWEIDKYKFLPMISDAYHTLGNRKKWFVFVEADTYISLHNLLLWLQKLDSSKSIYAGAQIFIGDTEFGHGGSGFILSTPAAKALTESYERDVFGWEERLREDCCGDKILADVLLAADPPVSILRSFPIIQGETPASLDWSTLHWCRPAVSWHHVDTTTIDQLWQFERKWRASKGSYTPIRFADYFAAFVKPRLKAADWTLEGWDNLSNTWIMHHDDEEEAARTTRDADACRQFCESQWDCLQWVWSPRTCRASGVVKLGWALANRPQLGSADDRVEKIDGEQAVSGWFPGRIEEYHRSFEPCPDHMWITENTD